MKTYIQPAMEIQDIQFQELLAASIGLDKGNKYSDDGTNLAPGFRNSGFPGFPNSGFQSFMD